ncbi:MAG: iron-containing alcohol dehydrogenase [Candidatus Omnitrophica bacterium]|nr:iron-containing alcohol dehydrogenase [Candidatus Omnitrophota bacterium]
MPNSFSVRSLFREYSVEFIDNLKQRIRSLVDKGHFFVIDAGVYDLYQDCFKTVVSKDALFIEEAIEKAKTFENSYSLIKRLMASGVRKNTTLVAVGGGVIQDLTAFVSSILFRGIEWMFFPTTLLAQADSCIGSKTSINMEGYKNILGNFYPPSKIFIDLKFLESLNDGDIKSGIGEMMHFYFVAGSPYAEKIATHYQELFAGREWFGEYIDASLAIKKDVIERDEFDKGERNLFNYGHTFGHAIETITDYKVPHGQAVTLGMDIANYISLQRGMIDLEIFGRMRQILMNNLPKLEISDEQMDRYMDALSKDKKNTNQGLTCILTEGPGRMKRVCIPMDEPLRNMIGSCVNHYAVNRS